MGFTCCQEAGSTSTQTTIITLVHTVRISQFAFRAHKQVCEGGVAARILGASLCLFLSRILSRRIMDLKVTTALLFFSSLCNIRSEGHWCFCLHGQRKFSTALPKTEDLLGVCEALGLAKPVMFAIKQGPLACCPVRSQHLFWVIAGR